MLTFGKYAYTIPENTIGTDLGSVLPYSEAIIQKCKHPLQMKCSLQTLNGGTEQGKLNVIT